MNKWYDSNFADSIGAGILILLACIGVGSCSLLCRTEMKYDSNETLKHNPEKVEQK